MEKIDLASLQQFNEEKFTKRVAYQHGGSVIFVLNFMPGQELPTHKHPHTDVYILGLQGRGTMNVDGVPYACNEGDIIRLEGDEAFSYSNTGDQPSSLYVILTKVPDSAYAKEI